MNKITPTFTTTDGKPFTTRKEAALHQAFVNRVAKVEAVLAAADDAGTTTGLTTAQAIATLADQLVVALANPLERGRKAAAVAA